MRAGAARVAAIGSALVLVSVVALIILCGLVIASGNGTDFEGEIKAASFSLRLKVDSSPSGCETQERITRTLKPLGSQNGRGQASKND
jgi:hypothetical protein